MSHHPVEKPVESDVEREEHLANTDVDRRVSLDPEEQANREDAPAPSDLPGPPTGS
jgi:hypothetical protein